MSTEDLIRDIHRDVQKTSVTVSALDERSKAHTGQIKIIQSDVKSVQGTVARLDERTDTLKQDTRRIGAKSGVFAGGGAGGLLWLLSKAGEWFNGGTK